MKSKRNIILICVGIIVACVIVGLVIWRMIRNDVDERRNAEQNDTTELTLNSEEMLPEFGVAAIS